MFEPNLCRAEAERDATTRCDNNFRNKFYSLGILRGTYVARRERTVITTSRKERNRRGVCVRLTQNREWWFSLWLRSSHRNAGGEMDLRRSSLLEWTRQAGRAIHSIKYYYTRSVSVAVCVCCVLRNRQEIGYGLHAIRCINSTKKKYCRAIRLAISK